MSCPVTVAFSSAFVQRRRAYLSLTHCKRGGYEDATRLLASTFLADDPCGFSGKKFHADELVLEVSTLACH